MLLKARIITAADPERIERETKLSCISWVQGEGQPYNALFEIPQPFVDNLAKLQKYEVPS